MKLSKVLASVVLGVLLAATTHAQDDEVPPSSSRAPLPAPKTTPSPSAPNSTEPPTPTPRSASDETPMPADEEAPPDGPPYDAKYYWYHEPDPRYAAATGNFSSFTPDDATQTCLNDTHATPFNRQVRGANLGGWLVLEPWITPTLFYQFLGTGGRYGDQAPEKTAMDVYTFCTALGKEEANRQLRVHWANWVTEDDIATMAGAGINSLRVPVGDWMFVPYEPYVGCTDGAIEELDRVLDLAIKYDLDILLDIHGLIGSQNGFDNSGKSSAVKWTSIASTQPIGTTTFEHWPIRQAEWAGTFDPEKHVYTSINYTNLNHSLTVVEGIVNRYKDHPAVLGLQPVNEPWELTPIQILKDYYWKSYKRIKVMAPNWKFVLHDSFRFGLKYWADFMKGCPDIALDTHIYQAWFNPGTRADFYSNACQQKFVINEMENSMMPVIVGEWSLATDNCAMWLNGFNDNLPGFPKLICQQTPCPRDSTYLGKGFPGTPLDATKPIQGPYGTGTSGPSFGMCPINSNISFGQKTPEDDFDFTKNLVMKKINAFAVGHGWYFWNFKTEFAHRWDFLYLIRSGILPKNVSELEDAVVNACLKEDKGDFICRAKRGVKPYELKNGLRYACNTQAVDCTDLNKRFLTLEEQCDWAFNEYWHKYRKIGATCDFGGAAHLLPMRAAEGTSPTPGNSIKDTNTRSNAAEGESPDFIKSDEGVSLLTVGGVVFGVIVGAALYRWYLRSQFRQQYNPIDRA